MAGKLSPSAQMRLAELRDFDGKVQRLHGLVEQYATARSGAENFESAIRRGFGQMKLQLMGAGLDAMSQLAGSMEIAAKRGMSQVSKGRILREGVGSLKFQLELAQRSVVSDDEARRRKEAEAEG